LRFPAIAEEADELDRTSGEPLWPARFDTEQLDQIKKSLPLHWWEALYQQQPGHHTHLLWPPDYFKGDDLWFDQWPDDLKLRVMTLDPSKGRGTAFSDYSAYVMLGVQPGGTVFVEADMSNSRPPTQLVEDGVQLHSRFAPDAFRIESNAWQDLLSPLFVEAFRKRGVLGADIGHIENRINKRLRIEMLDPLLRSRQFRFRRTAGTELLVDQLKNFPVARHDDGPDALEMAVRTARELWNTESTESITPWNLRGGLF